MWLKRNVGRNDGVVTYPPARLEREGEIRSSIQGARRRYYPVGMRIPAEDGGDLHEIQRRLPPPVARGPRDAGGDPRGTARRVEPARPVPPAEAREDPPCGLGAPRAAPPGVPDDEGLRAGRPRVEGGRPRPPRIPSAVGGLGARAGAR